MFETDDEKEEFYFHMKAGAETGWDYSTRWMIDAKGNNHGGLREIKTNYIVPVDLNSLMFMNYANLAEFHSLLGDPIMAEKYMAKADEMQAAIKAVLWCEEDRMWYDFDLINNASRIKIMFQHESNSTIIIVYRFQESSFIHQTCFLCGPSVTKQLTE